MTSAPSTEPATGRSWLSPAATEREREILAALDLANHDAVARRVHELIARNRDVHDRECINLNPASNVMNPRAEAIERLGGEYEARVLEPSPPAVQSSQETVAVRSLPRFSASGLRLPKPA